MKKIYLTIALGLAGHLGIGQTISGADINPVAGESFTLAQSAWVNPGSSGSGQTWNLSSMNNAGAVTVTNSTSTVPGANIQQVWSTGVTIHLNVDATKHDIVRQIASGVNIAFSNPWTFYGFPLSLNATGTDNYASSFTSNGFAFQRTGTSTWTVDGSGTLTTPSGTFTNVLRIKVISDYTDMTTGLEINYTLESYTWVKAGFRHPLAHVEDTQSDFGGGSGGTYLNMPGLSIEANSIAFNIFPNPTSDFLNISATTEIDFQNIQILDLSGKVMMQSTSLQLDVQALAEGIYFVVIYDRNNAIIARQKFLKK